ncbi:pro-epidermal growth factor isoform X2 [Ambystoma mexicanum]|uniref:pro-epidermal growth factor isoform X2 n=1 Tax=Ambystoma mexicanum TaxID=8296 RepID=UPI0037E8C10F
MSTTSHRSGSAKKRKSEQPEPEPFLIFSHGKSIFRIDRAGTNQQRLVDNAGTAPHLDFHHKEGRAYWMDSEEGALHRVYLNGTQQERVKVIGVGMVGFAINWVNHVILWANRHKGTIEETDMSGNNSRVLVSGLVQPTCVSVDSLERFIFWSSESATSAINRVNLDGSSMTSLLSTTQQVVTLTLDVTDRRIFWIQYSLEEDVSIIGSCDYSGGFVHMMKHSGQHHLFGISIFADEVYYSEWETGIIRRSNKRTGKEVVRYSLRPPLFPPPQLKVVHRLAQPAAQADFHYAEQESCHFEREVYRGICKPDLNSHQCKCPQGYFLSWNGVYCEDVNECAFWNHGCTLGCANIPGSYFCTCPAGFVLLPDQKTCHGHVPCPQNDTRCSHGCYLTAEGPVCYCPEGSILDASGHKCTGCTSPDNGGCSQRCVLFGPMAWECDCFPGYDLQLDGKHCKASGPTPFLLFANLHDLRRMSFDGSDYESLLDWRMGRIVALDYDPVENKIYFAHTGLKWIECANLDGSAREKVVHDRLDEPEGLAVDWINRKLYWTDKGMSCIERSDLNGTQRETIIKEGIHRPRGIAIHPSAKRIFWTDMGHHPRIESSFLEGSERMVIASTNLVWPSGITIDYLTNKLYWCDAKQSIIETANLDGSGRQTLAQNEVGHPFGIAVFEDNVWFSDWTDPSVIQMDKRTGQNRVRLGGSMQTPSSLVIVHPLAKPGVPNLLMNESLQNRAATLEPHFINQPSGAPVRRAENRQELPTKPDLVAEIIVSDQDDSAPVLVCDINAQHIPTEDGVKCQCFQGFTGSGHSCEDIDECSTDIALCNQTQSDCTNTEGGYVCKCFQGYNGDGLQCQDIDECMLGRHACTAPAICTNTEGNYTCTCPDGLLMSGAYCEESTSPATASHRSTAPPVRRNYVEDCPDSHKDYCFSGGVCLYILELEAYACKCASGFVGSRCQFSNLNWWEQQHVEELERRNVTIAACMVTLTLLLALGSWVAYYYRTKKTRKKGLCATGCTARGESRSGADSQTEPAATTKPRLFVVLECSVDNDDRVVEVINRDPADLSSCPAKHMCGHPSRHAKGAGLLADGNPLGNGHQLSNGTAPLFLGVNGNSAWSPVHLNSIHLQDGNPPDHLGGTTTLLQPD